jgi:UPF0042 nucleotide-binding protein
MPDSEITKVALGLDVRSGQRFEDAPRVIEEFRKRGLTVEVLFLECSDAVLVKRYKESRRKHPLSPDGRIEEGITKERQLLGKIRTMADYIIDTSQLLTREFKTEMEKIFVANEKHSNLMVTILSFGFKHGIPSDADLVFDVRFLPNPFYIDELKHLTGNVKEVQDYVKSFPECGQFLDKLTDMLEFLVPGYINEGKYQLVVAIGCTGGQHRSVTIANEIYEKLKDRNEFGIKIYHRDLKHAR